MWHYYIYYRVDAADEPALQTQIHNMQARLKCRTGVAGRLLKQRENPLLWMEIYENVEDSAGFERALGRAVDEFEVEMFLASGTQRAMECFSDQA
jgi:hypothetical protein